jgi:hypothetical protein
MGKCVYCDEEDTLNEDGVCPLCVEYGENEAAMAADAERHSENQEPETDHNVFNNEVRPWKSTSISQ